MGESYESISKCSNCTLTTYDFCQMDKYTFGGIAQYLETFHIPPTGSHWVDTFLLPTPTLLIHQFERAEREGELLSPTETADDEANDEVFHPCCTCQVCKLHYLVFDGNGRAHAEDNVDLV